MALVGNVARSLELTQLCLRLVTISITHKSLMELSVGVAL